MRVSVSVCVFVRMYVCVCVSTTIMDAVSDVVSMFAAQHGRRIRNMCGLRHEQCDMEKYVLRPLVALEHFVTSVVPSGLGLGRNFGFTVSRVEKQ